MDKLSLSVTVEEANGILNALSKFPYEQVAKLIANLQQQANEQIAAKSDSEGGDV